MTLPAWREDAPQPRHRPRPMPVDERHSPPGQATSPANQLLRMLEEASLPGGGAKTRPGSRQAAAPADLFAMRLPRRLAGWLLGWSCLALGLSVAYLALETLKPEAATVRERPALDFTDVASRHVMSSEGPALELSGLVRNAGETPVEPDVVLQLAGNRVAIEERVRLGAAALPPGAERPFTVRVLLPRGTKTVRLLPPSGDAAVQRSMPLISPAWTAPPPSN